MSTHRASSSPRYRSSGPTALRLAVLLAVLVFTGACDSDHYLPDLLHLWRLDVVSGDHQTAPAGSTLDPLVVRLTDRDGDPVSNADVFWDVRRGGGNLDSTGGACTCDAISTTDAHGYAEIEWTLGPDLGRQQVEAWSVFTTTRVLFEATAE